MKSITDRISDTFKNKKVPGFNELFTLLNFEDLPTALVDNTSQSLLFINSRLIKIVAFSNKDIYQMPVQHLFPELDLSTVSTGEIRAVKVNRREKSAVKYRLRFEFIDQTAQWIVVKFLPEIQNEAEKKQVDQKVFKELRQFTQLSDIPTLTLALQQSTTLIKEMLGTEFVGLYQADSEYPQLRLIAATEDGDRFAATLPSTDLMRLDKTHIWMSGNRLLTEIHRSAQVNQMDYLASTPLIQGGGAFGLLVAAGKGEPPANMTIDLLELLAAMILSLFQQNLLIENLNHKVEQTRGFAELRNTAFENMNEGVVVLDKNLVISEINQAIEWMLGYSAWEARGQSFENILIGTARLLPALVEAQKGKTTNNIGKASLNRRNGQSFPIQGKVIPVMDGETAQAIEMLITDISEHEQSKAVTQQLEHRAILGDYTAAFAHDVRNPINNISTGLQVLAAMISENDPNQDVVNRMQGDCTRLNHLMEAFLAFSRPLELKFESFDVEPFLKRILDRWQPRMARVNVKSTLLIEPEVRNVFGDPRSLENVFTNLISNAVEAMAENGDTLVVKAAKSTEIDGHPSVEVSISDNGPGIPQDILEHIFEPFVTTRKAGTGLGLAITKQIVTAHKGSIRVNSFPGGTVFTVQIPAEGGD
jgi:PAS domain S-box-containing protein